MQKYNYNEVLPPPSFNSLANSANNNVPGFFNGRKYFSRYFTGNNDLSMYPPNISDISEYPDNKVAVTLDKSLYDKLSSEVKDFPISIVANREDSEKLTEMVQKALYLSKLDESIKELAKTNLLRKDEVVKKLKQLRKALFSFGDRYLDKSNTEVFYTIVNDCNNQAWALLHEAGTGQEQKRAEPLLVALERYALLLKLFDKVRLLSQVAVDPNLVTNFMNLYKALQDHRNQQTFVIIAEHFIGEAQKTLDAGGRPRPEYEIRRSAQQLKYKLFDKSHHLSRSMTITICCVFGVLVGLALGAAIVGVATAFCGSVGAIPGGTAGAVLALEVLGMCGATGGTFGFQEGSFFWESQCNKIMEINEQAFRTANGTLATEIDKFDPSVAPSA